ncbi:Ig-like domain-containing protein [Grimontia sp. AD028]|uniref:Ig-like domain-containing protein n=1 Tax=Grimontia sp. AD028 TaxID=1581149 RepID=UPI000696D50A|nr:Ig-like domain-containing protein [Grimontia sp. AD028]
MKRKYLSTLIVASSMFASVASYAQCFGNVYSMNAGRGHVGALIDIKESASIPSSNYTLDAATRAQIHSKALFSSSAMAYDRNTDRIYYASVPAPVTYYMDNAEVFFSEEELKNLDFHAQRTTPSTLAYFDVATQKHVEVATTRFGIYRMAFHPETGELYASDAKRLFKVSPESGEVTEIGEFPLNARAGGFTTWGDFEFYNNELLYVTSGRTFTVDLSTADLTLKAFHFVDFVTSVTTDQNGQLIMAAKNQNVTGNINSNQLWRLKPETGEKVQVGLFPTRISAMATATSEAHTCYEKTIFPSDVVPNVDVTNIEVPTSATQEGASGTVKIILSDSTQNDTQKLLINIDPVSASFADFSQNVTIQFSNDASPVNATLPTDGSALEVALPEGVDSVSFNIDVTADTSTESQESFIVSAKTADSSDSAKTAEFWLKDDESASNEAYVSEITSIGTTTVEEGFAFAARINFSAPTSDSSSVLSVQIAGGVSPEDFDSKAIFIVSGSLIHATIDADGYARAQIPAGISSVDFVVSAVSDGITESDEFAVVLAGIVGQEQNYPGIAFVVKDDGSNSGSGSETNTAPVAQNGSASTDSNTTLNGSVPTATDADGTVTSYQLVTNVGEGQLSFNTNGSYTYVPGSSFSTLPQGQTRTVSFTYTATDDDGAVSAPKTITISVRGTYVQNSLPVAQNGSVSTNAGTTLNSNVPVATDSDGTVTSYQLATNVSEGQLSFNANGSYSFVPGTSFDNLVQGQSRSVSFTYTATDNDGGVSAPKTITISVLGVKSDVVEVDSLISTGETTEGRPAYISIVLTNETKENNTPITISLNDGSAKSGSSNDPGLDYRRFSNIWLGYQLSDRGDYLTPTVFSESGTTIYLPKGIRSLRVEVATNRDNLIEGNESFSLSAWMNANRSDRDTETVTIIDGN